VKKSWHADKKLHRVLMNQLGGVGPVEALAFAADAVVAGVVDGKRKS
jgi:hypothetical protein